jgi:hypothetical protein
MDRQFAPRAVALQRGHYRIGGMGDDHHSHDKRCHPETVEGSVIRMGQGQALPPGSLSLQLLRDPIQAKGRTV